MGGGAVLVLILPWGWVPPLILVLPPLIWGWLTYRVMTFDALAEHASGEERREIFRRHRMQLLGIGVFTGYLGAAPSLVWASGALFAAALVVLVPVAIWIYTLVFAGFRGLSGGGPGDAWPGGGARGTASIAGWCDSKSLIAVPVTAFNRVRFHRETQRFPPRRSIRKSAKLLCNFRLGDGPSDQPRSESSLTAGIVVA